MTANLIYQPVFPFNAPGPLLMIRVSLFCSTSSRNCLRFVLNSVKFTAFLFCRNKLQKEYKYKYLFSYLTSLGIFPKFSKLQITRPVQSVV